MQTEHAIFVQTHTIWAWEHRWQPGQTLFSHTPALSPPVYKFWLMLEGSVEITDEDRYWHVSAGDAFIAHAAMRHQMTSPHGAHWFSIGLQAARFQDADIFADAEMPFIWRPTPDDLTFISLCAGQLAREWSKQDLASALAREGLGRTLVGYCQKWVCHNNKSEEMSLTSAPWLTVTMPYLRASFNLNVSELAHIAGLSTAHFRRVFHTHFGMSPQVYLRRQKLESSKRFLSATDLSVMAIAEQVGFASASHFTRFFTQEMGMSPVAYRHMSSGQSENP